ncbi:hypothetical protein [Streptomyces sp. NPDC057199]|uniref:hypothetical protein n=1 Tax=Streptomyces sp. NPDC057199 TaxID=3346047 RepID=UPI00363CE21D
MGTMPVSAALLVKVALEATGPGEGLWEGLKRIIERSGSQSSQADVQLGIATLDSMLQAPLDSRYAIELIEDLTAQARSNAQLLADLGGWAAQAMQLRPTDKLDVLSPHVVRGHEKTCSSRRTEAHFAVYGGPVDTTHADANGFPFSR